MAPSNESNEPPRNDSEYSGPYEGDERDPKSLSEIVPEVAEDLERRKSDSELLQARTHYKDLVDRRAAGEPVSDVAIDTARAELSELEAQHRRWQPPEE